MDPEPLKLFHDQFLATEEEQKKWHGLYQSLAAAIDTSLWKFLELVKALEIKLHADGKNIHSVALMLMYDFADSIDGASMLAFLGASKNCAAPLRIALEIGLAVQYILEDDATYEQRSLAYEYFSHLAELKTAQKCDPTHEEGIRIRQEMEGDQHPGIYDVTDPTINVKAEIAKWEKKLASPRYVNVKAEIDRMKAEGQKPKNWHSLWKGPGDMAKMAWKLKMLSIYEALYRPFSKTIHGAGALKRIGKLGADGYPEFEPLRSPSQLPSMVLHACHLANTLSVTLLQKRIPERWPDFQAWYAQHMKPAYDFINTVNIK